MRPSRRLLHSNCAIVVLLLVLLSNATLAQNSSAPGQAVQSMQAAPATQAELPAKWNEAVRALAGKIASSVHPQRTIALDVRNLSSLSAQDVTTIRLALESELKQRQFRILSPDSTSTQVQVTFSESTETYIWVAKIQRGQGDEREPQVVIVAVEKAMGRPGGEKTDSLSLNRKLIWEQVDKILDFAIIDSAPGSSSQLLVLEPEKLVFYRGDSARRELERMVSIPHSMPWPRNVGGWIDTRMNLAHIPGVVCSGDFLQPESVRCKPSDPRRDARPEIIYKIPDREGVDTAAFVSICGEGLALLATGTGDWTQPDSIQGYVTVNGRPAASGAPIDMDSPVMWLYRDDVVGSARAVVRNLKTGNYEAYIVTATCSH
jgi:hypothetical protein